MAQTSRKREHFADSHPLAMDRPMVDTIIYRIRRPNGSFVDEPVDLPPSVASAVSSLMRMHGGATAAPVDVALVTYVAGGKAIPSAAVAPAPAARRRLHVAATTAALGAAVLCGALLGRAIRPAAEQIN